MEKKVETSSIPWKVDENIRGDKNIIVDKNGQEVCAVLEHPEKIEIDEANAELIAVAVNERKELVHVKKIELPYFKARIARLENDQRTLRRLVRELLPPAIVAGLSNANMRRICVDAYRTIGKEAERLLEGHRQVLDSFEMEMPEEEREEGKE